VELVDARQFALNVRIIGFGDSEQAHGTLFLRIQCFERDLDALDALLASYPDGAAFAEYSIARTSSVFPMPKAMSFEEAAALDRTHTSHDPNPRSLRYLATPVRPVRLRRSSMMRTIFPTRLTTRWLFLVLFAALLCNSSPGEAATAPSLNSAANFGVLAGSAVTCTNSALTGDVGVVSSIGFTGTLCTSGTVHRGDSAATMAYADFLSAYVALQSALYPCTGAPLSGTLANVTLAPGIYCFTAAATLAGRAGRTSTTSTRDGWIMVL